MFENNIKEIINYLEINLVYDENQYILELLLTREQIKTILKALKNG